MKHLFLVDGSGFIFRAYHALPPLTRSDGTPVNAVQGFTAMLLKLLNETDASHVAVIFDAARKTFRSDIYPEYKAQRPPPPEDLVPQFSLIRDATRAMNLPCIERETFEADDIIATYARQAVEQGYEVTVVSSDKDLMQLVNGHVGLWDAMKNRPIGRDEVVAKFGVPPEQVVDVQALCGDSVDNVPGVPGIGVKTAAQLILQYGTLENLLDHTAEIKQPKRRQNLEEHRDLALISKKLVLLDDHVPVDHAVDDFAVRTPDPQKLIDFLNEMEFRRLATQVHGRMGVASDVDAQAAAALPPETIDYTLVQDADTLARWAEEAMRLGCVAVDTETDSLNPRTGNLVGLSLALESGRACYVPLRHVNPQGDGDLLGGGGAAPTQIGVAEAVEILRPMLADPGTLKVGHNIKFDLHVLAKEGLTVAPIDDTMVLSYVLDGASHGHGMDELARLHFGHDCITYKSLCGSGKSAITFDKVALDAALTYAAEDADITLRLHRLFKERLVAERMVTVYETLDRPLVSLLFAMEAEGIKIDALKLKDLSQDFAARMAEHETACHELAGEAFNVGSPKQLGEILFERMSLPGGKRSKSGQYTTSAEVLEDLAAQGHDLPARVLEWRSVQKLKSTYTDALVKDLDDASRVHTTFSQTVTTTGRLSSSEPNLQNIPVRTDEGRKIRQAFVAEPGHVLLSADYSQIELRLVAHVAGIKALRQAFIDGQDIHAITAAEVFGIPLEGMDPMVRRRAKAINFGIIYGISAFGLSRQLSIPRGEAAGFIDAYFEKFPEIRDYMERTKEEARTHGFVRTALGRKCFTPGIREKNPNLRAFAERAAINAPIQGGAADILKRAMIVLPRALSEAGLAARMLLQVHDELVFEVPEAEADTTAALVKRVMEDAATLDVPLVVDTGLAATWAEAH